MKESEPLTPPVEAPALPVRTLNAPLDVARPKPEASDTAPPVTVVPPHSWNWLQGRSGSGPPRLPTASVMRAKARITFVLFLCRVIDV